MMLPVLRLMYPSIVKDDCWRIFLDTRSCFVEEHLPFGTGSDPDDTGVSDHSLDDLLAVVREFLNPDVSRSGLDRCLRRQGVGNLRDLKAKDARPKHSGFLFGAGRGTLVAFGIPLIFFWTLSMVMTKKKTRSAETVNILSAPLLARNIV